MTTIPVVLSALTTLGGATLTGWQAINGPAGSVTTTEDRLIRVGDEDVAGERELATMGLGTASEQYTVPIVLSVSLPGTDQQAADALVLAAYDLYERAIRGYPGGPNLGLSASGVLKALPTGDFRLTRRATDDGRHAAIRFVVQVYAQNT